MSLEVTPQTNTYKLLNIRRNDSVIMSYSQVLEYVSRKTYLWEYYIITPTTYMSCEYFEEFKQYIKLNTHVINKQFFKVENC